MRKLALAFIFVIVIGVGLPVAVGTFMWTQITDRYRGYTGAEQFIQIPPGAGTAEIGRGLVEGGIVKDEWTFKAALWWTGQARALKAGEYRFERPMTAVDVVGKLARGDTYGHRVTFPEGLTIADMAKIYEAQQLGKARDFVDAARDVSLIADLDPMASDLEGYLYPETYTLPRGVPAAKLISQMVGRFRAVYTDDLRARAEAQGLTTRQVMTLASLVEKETAQPEERAMVAAVYRNRMKIGMPMQADPTVVYALQKAGRYTGNIRKDDLSLDSPYNTYRYPGLPPGPIAAPGKPSIEAALEPADVKSLYFVSRNNGTHVFADTLDAHNRNVHQFQVEYFRTQRAQDRKRQP